MKAYVPISGLVLALLLAPLPERAQALPPAADPLPVSLTSFSVARQGRNVVVKWAMASAYHSSYFWVERSALGTTDWQTVAGVPLTGDSNSPQQYAALDAYASPGLTYYRLRIEDDDHTFSFGPLQTVQPDEAAAAPAVAAYPNPATQRLSITGAAPGSPLTLTNVLGMTQARQTASAAGLNQLDVETLTPGTYLLHAQDARGQACTVRITKQ